MSKAGRKRVHKVAMRVAAVGVATSIAGVAATQPESISASLVDLAALIVVGSSTHPDGSGNEDFFQGQFTDPPYTGPNGDDIVHVNFFTGPAGINEALQANAGEANAREPNAVLASGWGAANASLLLRQLDAQNDPILKDTVFIFDNDVAMPNGGFGTRYPWFALIGVNPLPTPSDTGALGLVEVAYEYDYNSNAPADVWNLLAAVNSLVAYLYRHLNQNELKLPVDIDGSPSVTCGANTCGITDKNVVLACPDAQCSNVPADDRVAVYVTKRDNTTYVTYTSDGLPLTRLIRDVVPFGNVIADLTEPLLKTLVDSAYPGGNPIPADPSKYQPARLFPPPDELVATATKIPGAIRQGLAAVTGDAPSATTTSTTSTADVTATLTTKAVEPDPPTGDEKKPLLNVVRDSKKAVPGTVEAGSTSTKDPEPTDTVDNSTATEPCETTSNEDSQSGTTVTATENEAAGEAAGEAS
jgi:PE-PPE domain